MGATLEMLFDDGWHHLCFISRSTTEREARLHTFQNATCAAGSSILGDKEASEPIKSHSRHVILRKISTSMLSWFGASPGVLRCSVGALRCATSKIDNSTRQRIVRKTT